MGQFHPTRDAEATSPCKAAGVASLTSTDRVHLGPELLTSLHSTASRSRCSLQATSCKQKSVCSCQHSHHLSEETPSRRGEGAKWESLALRLSVHLRERKQVEGAHDSSSYNFLSAASTSGTISFSWFHCSPDRPIPGNSSRGFRERKGEASHCAAERLLQTGYRREGWKPRHRAETAS